MRSSSHPLNTTGRSPVRFRPQPFDGKAIYLLSASPSLAGGNRGLWSLRVPLEHLGAQVHPDMFSLAAAHRAFAGGNLADAELARRLVDSLRAFLSIVEAIKNYPCIKRAWVEFLGEPPGTRADPLTSPAPGR
jgi:chromate reductase, NAD(P)H dehydrogenase (quinone)